jgi:hypothetical protein
MRLNFENLVAVAILVTPAVLGLMAHTQCPPWLRAALVG